MKNFTVKEVSEILSTNPETVRRWIRDGRLDAIRISRKDGNVISESALSEFLRKTPKYATTAATSLASSFTSADLGAIAGLSVFATTAIIGMILADKKPTEDIRISPSSFEKYIMASIRDHENTLTEKKSKLASLQQEIANEQKQIDELRTSLERIILFSEEKKGTAEKIVNKGESNG